MSDNDFHVEVYREQLAAFWRHEIGTFVLGPKGKHVDGDEWERRADGLYRRCVAAENAFARTL